MRYPSQVQQSLQRPHFSHKWLAQASRVQRGQIFSDELSQMWQRNRDGVGSSRVGGVIGGVC